MLVNTLLLPDEPLLCKHSDIIVHTYTHTVQIQIKPVRLNFSEKKFLVLQLINTCPAECLCILFMVALCNRETIYIFILFLLLLSFFFFSSPNLSSRRLDVYHTSAHGVVLV